MANQDGQTDERRGAPEVRDAGFRAPRRRRKLLLGAAVVVFAVVGGMVFLMARGPDPADVAAQRVEAMLEALPAGVLAAEDIRAAAGAVTGAFALDAGNDAASSAAAALGARLEAQLAEQIAAGALDEAREALAAAAEAWPDGPFDDGGALAGELAVATEERALRAEVARLVAAAAARLQRDGPRERDGAALRDALKELEAALAIDPDNDEARSARADIATEAKTATREALAAGQPERARRVLNAVAGGWPEDSELGGLRREVEDKLEAVNRQMEVDRLVGLGAERLARDRLGQPAGDNAVEYFRRALALAPGNAAAEEGLARAGSRYAALTRSAVAEGDLDRARWLRGSFGRTLPEHPDLFAVSVEIEKAESAAADAAEREAETVASVEEPAVADGNGGAGDPEPAPTDDEGRLWHDVKDSCRSGDLQRYTTAYPAGRYAEEAWRRMSACLEARE